ncbi:rhamnan synthesis F family protein [Mesorhizobium sangaii]|uniref:Rhamnosyltransferase n=1 Tax=Mesorhizobium sangaii TaxID=505389 RepID=A0A841PI96_9HYPH|nr:rhamnosyltransferase [Mesorhizobium sangaii]
MAIDVAIVAHFDPNDRIESNFCDFLACLRSVFDKVVLITTSEIGNLPPIDGIEAIKRPNIGYDFYSYRVGVERALRCNDLEHIALINSSVVLLDAHRLSDALRNMIKLCDSYDAVGATSSRQFGWHIQSYMMVLGRGVFSSEWFQRFFSNISPMNTKMEMILNYEIGFSSALVKNGVKVATLLSPASKAAVNWSHISASSIAQQFGYVKMEVLRDNPHEIDVQGIRDSATEERLKQVDEMVERARGHYQVGEDNLFTLKRPEKLPLSTMKTARWRLPHRSGVLTAVVVHLYYIEMIDEICDYLENIIVPFDVFVTTPFEGDVAPIIDRFAEVGASVSVYLTENRGRDIGPFVSLYRSGDLDGYDAILKIHSKKSTYSDRGDEWRNRLYRSLVGDSLIALRAIDLLRSGEIGIVGPHDYYLTNEEYWGANRDAVRDLLTAMDVHSAGDEPELGFFAGSMFWFHPSALRSLQRIDEEKLRFEPENGIQDGTLAHAVERVFCTIARKAGYRTTSAALKGYEIHHTETEKNNVPVL